MGRLYPGLRFAPTWADGTGPSGRKIAGLRFISIPLIGESVVSIRRRTFKMG
ncbi:hypothetical protein PX52LOC_00991 [Limnoglobus roseus]|uniref:Uncharacterized protein n=1 Tax=Limnoglobus roseus TaxID=2598579 RepID=A0A5C1A6W4_9BACT|nr:hypothetical protein PX52LOC_00991 [Limnoglobus roseus]